MVATQKATLESNCGYKTQQPLMGKTKQKNRNIEAVGADHIEIKNIHQIRRYRVRPLAMMASLNSECPGFYDYIMRASSLTAPPTSIGIHKTSRTLLNPEYESWSAQIRFTAVGTHADGVFLTGIAANNNNIKCTARKPDRSLLHT